MIPILNLKSQIAPMRTEIDAAIKKVIDNAVFVFGQEIRDFEDEVSRYSNVKYAIGVSSGTDAIKLSLLALGISPGDGVICPAFTYYATAGAIATIGAVPVFADIDPDTYNLSVLKIEETIRSHKKIKIKAIIPVHLYGQCADMDAIKKIARKYSLWVVEDTAQAFGAEYKGRKAGTIGDCGAVSFFPGKNLGAFGDAGMVLTNDKTLDEKLRLYRNQGNREKYYHQLLGFNHRMDTIQAAVLRVKLKYLDTWNKRRVENAEYFKKNLKDTPLTIPFVPEYTTHVYHQYVVRTDSSRDKLLAYLRDKGIEARVYYPLPLHLQECFKYLGHKTGDFPEAEKAAAQTLAIPVYPDLTKEELGYIVSSVKEFLGA